MIKLEHVDKYFGDLHVLKDVNLEVAEGEKLVIIGPSGSGKSTTVRCMNFLEEPTSGHVYIDGQELTNKNKTRIVRDNMSMVFQQFNLYPHMTVLKNLTLAPMKLHHKTKAEAEELAYHYLEVVGLRDKADVYPPQLSGGQQQRIAIARVLCAQTKIILFDEPTSALDPETIQEVLDVMVKLAHVVGIERHGIEKIAVGFVHAHHRFGEPQRVFFLYGILQFGSQVVKARYDMFLRRILFSHSNAWKFSAIISKIYISHHIRNFFLHFF